jgi:hypothetical protein
MSYANSHSVETTLNGTETITFPWPVRQEQITNDSETIALQFKLNASETFRTLKPFETADLENVRVTELYLSTTASVPYRIWGLG